jgi:hypothetical protein
MKSNELRIGNLVDLGNRIAKVTEINHLACVVVDLEETQDTIEDYERVKGIILTEEWLLKFGFELDIEDDGYSKGKYKVSVSDEGCIFFIYDSYYPIEICEFKYIHQLQNLYFALTGEELILNI